MKAIIFYIIISLLSQFTANAQITYEDGMNRAFENWTNEQYFEAANLFEEIAKAEKDNWLPYYYAALVKVLQSFPMENAAQKQQLLNDAQQLLDSAGWLEDQETELLVLQALLHTSRLTIDPATYGMRLSPVITKLYAQAQQKAPENPRVVLSKAEWEMGAARFFGEDPSKFCPDLKRSLKLFASEDISAFVAPAWGEKTALKLLKTACENN